MRTVTRGRWRITSYRFDAWNGARVGRPALIRGADTVVSVVRFPDSTSRAFLAGRSGGLRPLGGAAAEFQPLAFGPTPGTITGQVGDTELGLAAVRTPAGTRYPDPGLTGRISLTDPDGTGYLQRVENFRSGSNSSFALQSTCLRFDLRATGPARPAPLPAPPGGWVQPVPVAGSGSHCVGLLADHSVVGDGGGFPGGAGSRAWVSSGGATRWLPARWAGHPIRLIGTAGDRAVGSAEYTVTRPDGSQFDIARLVTSAGGAWRALRLPPGYPAGESLGSQAGSATQPGRSARHVIGIVQRTGDSRPQAVVWRDGGTDPEVLPRPDGGSAAPFAVNADGVVVGTTRRSTQKTDRAAMWRDGDRVDLSAALPAGTESAATAVSSAGVAAGTLLVDGTERLVIWSVRRV